MKVSLFSEYIRPSDLVADGLSISTQRSWRKLGLLPEPVQLGPRKVGWRRSVLEEALANRPLANLKKGSAE
jgi:predicted DNA-binding transcriptional regulator AlpA